MQKGKLLTYCLIILLLGSFNSVLALQIDTIAQYSSSGSADFDSDSGVSGTVSSSVASGDISAHSSGNEDGNIAANANYLLANGDPNVSAVADVSWTETYLLTESGDFTWDFTITDGNLTIWDNSFGSTMKAGYNISILLDGVVEWNSAFEFEGGRTPGWTDIRSGTDLGGTFFGGSVFASGYEFGSYSGSLDLGSLLAGDTFEITYMLSVYAEGPGAESGAQAYFGDPNNLAGGGMFGELSGGSGGPAPVPEPTTMLLFGTGLIGLAGIGRKKTKK